MNTLIVAEKPSVALRLAIALGNGKQRRVSDGRVGYYQIDSEGSCTYVVAAVGHLFTIRQIDKSRDYPVFDVEWAPSYEVGKGSAFTKLYLDVIRSVAKKCDRFVNACDFDTEGTVIGTNIIRDVAGVKVGELGEKAKRMKFSTTTIPDLVNSFSNMMDLDINNFYAGEARHMIDWLWGINLSRALTSALRKYGTGKQLSIGRVQGPTLGVLAEREKSISDFNPKPYWKITISVKSTEFTNDRGDIFDKSIADAALRETEDNASDTRITEVEKKQMRRWPYPPFDLTGLQLESSRVFKIDPSTTLSIAQSLYERSYISYPRTSSQKLPPTLGLPKIIEDIAKNLKYKEMAEGIISSRRFRPVQGAKSDEAHPAIFPTGIEPNKLSDGEKRIYDMIVRRFLSCFSEPAELLSMRVSASIGKESYSASGSKITKKGWLDIYRFARIDEKEVDGFENGERCAAHSPNMESLQTKPPKRFSKAGLIAELERINLGTKATRASIIDTLFKRNYLEGSAIKVTGFGMTVYNALSKNCGMIMNVETTRTLEEEMEQISRGKKSAQDVVDESKAMLVKAIELFDKNKEKIGEEMKDSFREVGVIGKCPKCGGDLIIRRSKIGKQFVACTEYPKCTNTYPLPQNAKIVPTEEVCVKCKTPVIKVIRRGMPPFEIDLEPSCMEHTFSFKKKDKKTESVKGKTQKDRGAAEPAKKARKTTVKKKRTATKKAARGRKKDKKG